MAKIESQIFGDFADFRGSCKKALEFSTEQSEFLLRGDATRMVSFADVSSQIFRNDADLRRYFFLTGLYLSI